jgi:hypothetical protein
VYSLKIGIVAFTGGSKTPLVKFIGIESNIAKLELK